MAKEQGRNTALSVLRGILLVFFNLILYSLLLFGIVWLCKSSYQFSYQVFGEVTAAEAPGTDVGVTIEPDEKPLAFAKELNDKNVVVNAYSFYLRIRLGMLDNKTLQPGDYTLNTSMTYEEILNIVLKSEAQ